MNNGNFGGGRKAGFGSGKPAGNSRSFSGGKRYGAGAGKGKGIGDRNINGIGKGNKSGQPYKPIKKSEVTPESNERNEEDDLLIEGRNSVLEALRAGQPADRLHILEGITDPLIAAIVEEAKKQNIYIRFEKKEKMDALSRTGHAQGVILKIAAYPYYEVEDLLADAEAKGEKPFLILLDGIEDPHNLGAIIRTAHQAGAHGVIIRENRAVGLTAIVAKTSAGALNYIKVARVKNIAKTIDDLKEKGMWFACADMDGTMMYDCDLTGALGIIVGNEGDGVSRLVKEKCDFVATVPMKGQIDSLNASVAAGVLMYEAVRQRLGK